MIKNDTAVVDLTARIADTAVLSPFRPLLDGRRVGVTGKTTIEAGVWIGHFTSHAAAAAMLAKLKSKGIDGFVAGG